MSDELPEEIKNAANLDANAAAYALCNGERGAVPGRYMADIAVTLVAFFIEARRAALPATPATQLVLNGKPIREGDTFTLDGKTYAFGEVTPPAPASEVDAARAKFYEAAREMMQAKRDEAASADFDNLLGLAVVMTTKAAHRAHYDLLNVEAAKRAARDGSK